MTAGGGIIGADKRLQCERHDRMAQPRGVSHNAVVPLASVARSSAVEIIVFGVISGSIILFGALGFSMTLKAEGFINVAHGQMLLLGAYLALSNLLPANVVLSAINEKAHSRPELADLNTKALFAGKEFVCSEAPRA